MNVICRRIAVQIGAAQQYGVGNDTAEYAEEIGFDGHSGVIGGYCTAMPYAQLLDVCQPAYFHQIY